VKTVLITGSRGFTGVYVAKLFEKAGYEVIRGVSHHPTEGESLCNLTDKASLDCLLAETKPTGIIHLAAMSFVGHGDETVFYHVNTVGTTNLLQAIDKADLNPEKIIIASSANVYGNPTVDVISETTPLNPISHYAVSKLAMEMMVKTWFDRFPISIVRPFNYTGVGQNKKFLVPKIVAHFVEKKRTIELGNLDVARDFSDVRDIAAAYLNLFESPVHSNIVNFCSGHTLTLAEILELMNELAGYEIEVIVNPDFVRKNEIKVLCGDNIKMEQLLGTVPSIPFIETLRAMYLAGKD